MPESEHGNIAAWLETPPPQPRWSRLKRFDSIYGVDHATGIQHWRGSEWRLELSRKWRVPLWERHTRRIVSYTRNRAPLTDRAVHYHGKRFSVRVTWQAKSDV